MSATTRLEFGHGERSLPILPLRDVVVYPHMVIPLFVGRERSMKALESAGFDMAEVLADDLVGEPALQQLRLELR